MKKVVYVMMVSLVVVYGVVFANFEKKNENTHPSTPKPLSATEMKAELKKWEASADGIHYKQWETSPEGTKVLASAAKLRKHTSAFSEMEAVVTSVSLPAGAQLGFGVMVKVNGDDYILSFGLENSNEFQQLHRLKVNDKIMIRSHFISYAPKYAYSIINGDQVERDGKIVYQRITRKGGC